MLLSEFSQWKLHQKPIIYRNIQRNLIYKLIFRNYHKEFKGWKEHCFIILFIL